MLFLQWRAATNCAQISEGNEHAVSVALPTWKDVIDYEEKETTCINLLQSIYTRFGLNTLLKTIAKEIISENNSTDCSAWPY